MRKRHVSKSNDNGAGALQGLQNTLERLAPKSRNIVQHQGNGQTERRNLQVKLRYMPVAWGFPLDEVLFSRFFVNALGLSIMPWDDILISNSTYLPEARNTVHNGFLETESEWLVMLDSDILPPLNFLDRLLSHGKLMVGGWYRKKTKESPPVVYDFDHEDANGIRQWKIRAQPGQGLEKVDGAGAGCWLMNRKVAIAIGKSPYNLQHGGEDLELCWKVHQAGFETWIDWDVACAHAGVFYV